MDLSSYSNPEETVVTHLDWTVAVDFEKEVLMAEATYTVNPLKPDARTLCLDTSCLKIISVRNVDGIELKHTLHSMSQEHLGQKFELFNYNLVPDCLFEVFVFLTSKPASGHLGQKIELSFMTD